MKARDRALLVTSIAALAACDPQGADGPPEVRLGDSVCDQCNMIISDERWATATIVDGLRGPEPRLFDDFNCQVNYESEHPDAAIFARWAHDFDTRAWVRAEEARFLMSPALRSPMGSKIAVFATQRAAEDAEDQLSGDLMTFDVAWRRLGHASATCHNDTTEADSPTEEHHHDP